LPANIANLILRLAESNDNEIRWRAVQGLIVGRETAKHLSVEQILPVLMRALQDPHNRIRDAAAFALSQRGEVVLTSDPSHLRALIASLEIHESEPWGDACGGLDEGAGAWGHIVRLLAAFSHRLDQKQRTQTLAAVQRAIRHFTGKHSMVMFDGMGVGTAEFLKEQLGLLRTPRDWGTRDLFESLAYAGRQDRPRSREDCEGRLAMMYSEAPSQTIAQAVKIVEEAGNRNAAIGAALWLMSHGSVAAAALPALEKMATGELDQYARDQARRAVEFIRDSMTVERDICTNATWHSARQRVAGLNRPDPSKFDLPALSAELEKLLEHHDTYLRAGAAELVARWVPAEYVTPGILRELEKLLTDETAVDVAVPGPFESEGRLYHWHRERRSPRASAIRALFAIDCIPNRDKVLAAMLAESMCPWMVMAGGAVPRRFSIDEWRQAASAAGGLAIAEPQIRAARQQCRERHWSGDTSAFAAEQELAGIIRQISGRLV
jgi:HEAT repeat protein